MNSRKYRLIRAIFWNNLSINPTTTHYILFQMRQCRRESELRILMNREIVNVKSTNRLSKILYMNVRRVLYYGLINPFLAYGIIVWWQSMKALTGRIFTLQERAGRYTVGLKQLESCRDSFRQLKIVTVYSLYIQETILYANKSVTVL
jgi:hypothetical protein